ncbi:MAG: hypothetical protein ACLTWE_16135 [Dysgonomonas mossii]|uniref:hypothetical protein n=1 Tax=Dysgonomonas mossii TaxID=163665 RepID=UPI0039917E49
MKMYFKTLEVICKLKTEVIDLSHHITFFHGKVSSGKSSIARIIDFCIGGDLEKTPAINSEFLSSKLYLSIENFDVILERRKEQETILVTWQDNDDVFYRVSAPISPSKTTIYNDDIFCLSDLLFYLNGIKAPRIAKNSFSDSSYERLSFRNFMWYCYLKQEHLDSSFYRFDAPILRRNSKEVLRFVLGFFTENLNQYEIDLSKTREKRKVKESTKTELINFLDKYQFSAFDIEKQLNETKKQLLDANSKKQNMQKGYLEETHASDRTRIKIIKIKDKVEELEKTIRDLELKISQQKSLESELISSKFKVERTDVANNMFSGISFEKCPCCGKILIKRKDDECIVCGTKKLTNNIDELEKFQVIKIDLESRISDLENSIDLHEIELKNKLRLLDKAQKDKINLDKKLKDELSVYESIYLSNLTEIESEISTYKERIKNLQQLSILPKEIEEIQKSINKYNARESDLKAKILLEKEKLNKSDTNIEELENCFANTLKIIGLPGVQKNDKVLINRRNWDITIIPHKNNQFEETFAWSFYDAGSGGKKTLFNVCFMLSLHIIAEKNNLPLPSFMMIDTPMKNIDKEVNRELFENFYAYLYQEANNSLKNTKIIIIDNSIIKPDNSSDSIDFYDKYMTPDDPKNPPLISYYDGP